jgi:dTDP-4-dehydrorhamnose 3,5-epimerase-like enzyme
MSKIISLPTHVNSTGKINVIEKFLPFKIKRVYFIYNISSDRGGHAHKKNKQAVLAIKGNCKILVRKKKYKKTYNLKNNKELLLLNPDDWHLIKNCSKDLILLVLASENYDPKDYLKEY